MAARTGNASLVGVIGQPVTHSLSPAIHEYWIAQAGLDACYIPFRHRVGDFFPLIESLRVLDVRGFNITVPYKSEILPYLTSIDPQAQAMGAVNTVVNEGGRWHGLNTDGSGYLRHLRASVEADQLTQNLKQTLILGAGGAARSIVVALANAGAEQIIICNRSAEKAQALASHLQPVVGKTVLSTRPWDERESALEQVGLVVNTTSLGMTGQAPLTLDLGNMRGGGIVSDIVYHPLMTPLLQDAHARGLVTVDGLGMLLGQAAEAYHAWFGIIPVVDQALRDRLQTMLRQ